MASRIVASDKCPEGVVEFSLGPDTITVPHETSKAELLSNASVHPWLKVEADAKAVNPPSMLSRLAPEDDAMSAVNSIANDPKAVAAEHKRRFGDVEGGIGVSIDANLNQNAQHFEGTGDQKVAKTIAAALASEEPDPKPKAAAKATTDKEKE